MKKVRLSTLPHNKMVMIRRRQINGTMSDLVDGEGYICYDPDELASWKPRKSGRPRIKRS